jgi:hypothetical protein
MKVQISKEMMQMDCLKRMFPEGGITIHRGNVIEYNPTNMEDIKFKKLTIDHKNQIETLAHVTVAYYLDESGAGICMGFAFCLPETDKFNRAFGRFLAAYRLDHKKSRIVAFHGDDIKLTIKTTIYGKVMDCDIQNLRNISFSQIH